MGRYLLFAWNNCFPNGGWNDFILSDDNIESMMKKVKMYVEGTTWTYEIHKKYYDQIQLVDKKTGNVLQLAFKNKHIKSKQHEITK